MTGGGKETGEHVNMEAEEEGTQTGRMRGKGTKYGSTRNLSPWSCSRAELGKMSVLLVQRKTCHKLHNNLFQNKKSYKDEKVREVHEHGVSFYVRGLCKSEKMDNEQ